MLLFWKSKCLTCSLSRIGYVGGFGSKLTLNVVVKATAGSWSAWHKPKPWAFSPAMSMRWNWVVCRSLRLFLIFPVKTVDIHVCIKLMIPISLTISFNRRPWDLFIWRWSLEFILFFLEYQATTTLTSKSDGFRATSSLLIWCFLNLPAFVDHPLYGTDLY